MAEIISCPICETMINLETDVDRSPNMSSCRKCKGVISMTVNPRDEDVIQAYKQASIC